MSTPKLNNKALVIADYMNQYIASENIDCADKLTQLRFNPKLEDKLEEEQWDLVIDYAYQNLLAHAMEDGVISNIERIELANLMNLKSDFRNTTREAIKYKIMSAVQIVEKSHEHEKLSHPYTMPTPKPTPWNWNDNKKNE